MPPRLLITTWILLHVSQQTIGQNNVPGQPTLISSPPLVTEEPAEDSVFTADPVPEPEESEPTLIPTPDCYDNLDLVYDVISQDALLFTRKTFVLCPNTVFQTGFIKPGIGIMDGQAPIIPRSNTVIKCGEDGSSTNNCIIRGGDYGLLVLPIFFPDNDITNVLIQGITFESNMESAMYFELPGDFTFVDCIVRNQRNQGPVVMNNIGPLEERRRGLSKYGDDYENGWARHYRNGHVSSSIINNNNNNNNVRRLQRNENFGNLEITFFNCKFVGNTQGTSGPYLEYGVITILNKYHEVTLDQCELSNNNFGDVSAAPYGYALRSDGAAVILDSNCFVDNDFFGPGTVILSPGSTLTRKGNHGTFDDDLDCSFVAWFETPADLENAVPECIGYESMTCMRKVNGGKDDSSIKDETTTTDTTETTTTDTEATTTDTDATTSEDENGDGTADSTGEESDEPFTNRPAMRDTSSTSYRSSSLLLLSATWTMVWVLTTHSCLLLQ